MVKDNNPGRVYSWIGVGFIILSYILTFVFIRKGPLLSILAILFGIIASIKKDKLFGIIIIVLGIISIVFLYLVLAQMAVIRGTL